MLHPVQHLQEYTNEHNKPIRHPNPGTLLLNRVETDSHLRLRGEVDECTLDL